MTAEVIHGNCLEELPKLLAAGVQADACITDPPYGLAFMGSQWDYQVPSVAMFREIHRALRNGSRLLCFAGTRTMHRMWCNIEDAGFIIEDTIMWVYGSGFPKHPSKLKPAYEPICVARKGRISELNIDGCRIEGVTASNPQIRNATYSGFDKSPQTQTELPRVKVEGRWPANLILDEEACTLLDSQSGQLTSGTGAVQQESSRGYRPNAYGAESRPAGTKCIEYGDTGGASRFFYCAKASPSERDDGCENLPATFFGRSGGAQNALKNHKTEYLQDNIGFNKIHEVRNNHPTVKPLSLMRYLCKLITKNGGGAAGHIGSILRLRDNGSGCSNGRLRLHWH